MSAHETMPSPVKPRRLRAAGMAFHIAQLEHLALPKRTTGSSARAGCNACAGNLCRQQRAPHHLQLGPPAVFVQIAYLWQPPRSTEQSSAE